MKQYCPTGSASLLAVFCGLALSIIPFQARADVWNKKTVLTVHEPIQVQNTRLDPGIYVLKLSGSDSNRHIVHIFNREENRVLDTILAIPAYRTQVTGDTEFTWHETPPGTAKAMKRWYYPGDNFGQEFRYPREPWMLASNLTRTLIQPPQEPAPLAAESAEPVAKSMEPEAEQPAPEEIPQNAPQDSMAEPAPQPQAPPAQEPRNEVPEELPKTATPYPLFGFGGLLSLAGYCLMRRKTAK